MVSTSEPLISLATTDLSSHINIPEKGFPIRRLPLELRQIIYTYYLLDSPPLLISSDSLSTNLPEDPHHQRHPLALASPFFEAEIPRCLYHATQLFEFKSSTSIDLFSASHNRKNEVRRIKVNLLSYVGRGLRGGLIQTIGSCFCELGDLVLGHDYPVNSRLPAVHLAKSWWFHLESRWRKGRALRAVSWKFGSMGFKQYPRLTVVDSKGVAIYCSQYNGQGEWFVIDAHNWGKNFLQSFTWSGFNK